MSLIDQLREKFEIDRHPLRHLGGSTRDADGFAVETHHFATKDGERVRLWARTTSDYSHAYTRIQDAVAALPVDTPNRNFEVAMNCRLGHRPDQYLRWMQILLAAPSKSARL